MKRIAADATTHPCLTTTIGPDRGHAIEDASVGYVAGAIVRGPTLAGRVFAEEQQEHVRSKSLWGRIKSGSTIFIGWLLGIISAVIIYYLTKK